MRSWMLTTFRKLFFNGEIVSLKTALILLMLGVGLSWSILPAQDMASFVSSSERLEKVFKDKNVSSPNNMQALLIKLCASVDSCGE